MSDALRTLGLASRRFYRVAEWIARVPWPWLQVRLSRRWGRVGSPFVADLAQVQDACAQAFAVPPAQAHTMAQQWLASQGLFATSIFGYHRMGPDWVRRHVRVHQPEALAQLRQSGGLVLSYHTHHHNTLGIVLGQSGVVTWGVAATEKASPMAPYTGRFMRIINGDSEARFGGGRYLFTDEPRQLLRGLNEAYAQNHAVVSICDNPMPAGEYPPVQFMGRQFHVGTGVIEHALSRNVPITVATLCPDLLGHYDLYLRPLPVHLSVPQVLEQYFDELAIQVRRAPWLWQGWHWHSGLAPL